LPIPARIALVVLLLLANHFAQQWLWDAQARQRRFLQQRRWGQLNPPQDGRRAGTWQEVKNPVSQTFPAAGRLQFTYYNYSYLNIWPIGTPEPPSTTTKSGPHTWAADNVLAYELEPFKEEVKAYYGGLISAPGTRIRVWQNGGWGNWETLLGFGLVGNGGASSLAHSRAQTEIQNLSHAGVAQPPGLVLVHRGPGELIDPAASPAPTPYPPAPLLPSPIKDPSPAGDPVDQPGTDPDKWFPWLPPPFRITTTFTKPIRFPKPTATPIPATPPNVSFPWPGSGPVGGPGQAPQPSLEGIATEVGKIERKLEIAFTNPKGDKGGLNWEEWWDAVGKLYNLLISLSDAGQFTLSSPCVPADEPGGVNNPLLRQWDGSLTPGGGLEKRLDALAGLIQDHKNLKQPICNDHQPTRGIAHRVRFISDGVSPRNGKRYLKDLGYRDQSGRPLVEHREHWKTFRWESGPFLVSSRGLPWGQPQVWAASFEEGRRVLTHAAAIAGVDVSSESHRWFERVQPSTRNGVVESFGVARDRTGEVWVVARDGSDGWPELAPEFRTDL
jgi:hypothetical protein